MPRQGKRWNAGHGALGHSKATGPERDHMGERIVTGWTRRPSVFENLELSVVGHSCVLRGR